MKKTLTILLTMLILTFSLVGCAKCISTKTSTVQVKVVDECYSGAYYTLHYYYPAMHRITVEYDGVEYNIPGSEAYNKYSDKIGEYVNGTLQTKTYDDGTVEYDIISLE